MTLHLVNFATAEEDAGYPVYAYLQKLQIESARAIGIEDIHAWTRRDVIRSDFYRNFSEHRYLLDHSKGAGYWLWKPYVILTTLKRIPEGDFLLYLDADFRFLSDPGPIVDVCRENDGFFLVELREPGRINRMWTKRDCFHFLDADTPYFHNAPHTPSGLQLYQSSSRTRQFLETWLAAMGDRRTVTDEENVCGKPNLEGFKAHRHDQSVLTIIKLKHKIRGFRWPTQWGNHGKLPEYRVDGEFTEHPYDSTLYPESRYGTLISDLIQEGHADPGSAFEQQAQHRKPALRRLWDSVRFILGRRK